jgi:hypothetical protein
MKNNTVLIFLFVVLVSLNMSTVLSLLQISESKNTKTDLQSLQLATRSINNHNFEINFLAKNQTLSKPNKNNTSKAKKNKTLKAKKNKTKKIDPKLKAKLEAEKEKRMSRYFVRRLIKTLDFNDFLAKKCVELATQSSLSFALDLSYNILTGKNKINDLVRLKDLLCAELKYIPDKLKNKVILNKVKDFIKSHME